MAVCEVCKSETFAWEDGLYVCQVCLTVLPGEVQLDASECLLTQTQRTVQIKSSQPSLLKPSQPQDKPEWVIYDGFNVILAHMTKGLLDCGVPAEVRDTVLGLWAAYLKNLGVAFSGGERSEDKPDRRVPSPDKSEPDGEPDLEVPEWMQFDEKPKPQPKGLTSGDETGADTDYADESLSSELPFVSLKTKIRKRKKKWKSVNRALFEMPESQLSAKELSKKKRLIKRDFLRQSTSAMDAKDVTEDEEELDCSVSQTRSSVSRRWSLIDRIPECFPERAASEKSARSKIAEFPASRSVLGDPEYLTLTKLLSFLHAALILRQQLTTQADLIRWVREGWIPFHGSHQLLPAEMTLTGYDALILGGISQKHAWSTPLSLGVRRNTAKLLVMLGVAEIQLPPVREMAARIVADLQLPDECVDFVANLERIAFPSTGWRTKKIGHSIPSVESYAGALLLIVLKLLLGVDGRSEFEISEFADKANQAVAAALPAPLFVWEHWARWIRFRRLTLDEHHVPTAIRHGSLARVDPALVLRYAETHGRLLYHRKKATDATAYAMDQVQRVLDGYIESRTGVEEDETALPAFQPCRLPAQGLAEQLLDFDAARFQRLRQSFARSTLTYVIDQQPLASLLRRASEPPRRLRVFHGPAVAGAELVTPFNRRHNQHRGSRMPPLQNKLIQLKAGPPTSAVSSNDDDDDVDDDDRRPSLLLYLPSSAYWSLSALTDQSKEAWQLVSSQLPATFVWLLELICESIEEEPQLVYHHTCVLESMVFQRSAKLLHTLADPKELKKRLVTALQHDINTSRR